MTLSNPILAITPNPTLDLGGLVDRILPDEKNYVRDETRFPGGNAINAARIIHRLGAPVVVSGFLGRGVGSEIAELLEAEGLRHRFIPIAGPARINVTVSAQDRHQQTRLSFPGPTISRSERDTFLKSLEGFPSGTLVILGGSLPPGFEPADLREAIRTLAEGGCECVVDVPGAVLREICGHERGPLLIKPNLVEFQQLTGTSVSTRKEVLKAARLLTQRVPVVCISSVEGGALLVTRNEAWFGQIPKIEVRSTVGAGDSMVGAMCVALARGPSPLREPKGDELLRWGLAAACATLSVHGTQLGSAEAITDFVPKIEITREEK